MPLRPILRFRNPDSTADLNARSKDIAAKGIFIGGDVTPVTSTLQVNVGLFGAVGADGMVTLLEGTPEVLTCIAGQTQRIVGRFLYVQNGPPTLSLEVLSEAAFQVDPQVASLITFASVTLLPAATEVTFADIDLTIADRIDQQVRSNMRGVIADLTNGGGTGLLDDYPGGKGEQTSSASSADTKRNRDGDVYFVLSERAFYQWNASSRTWNEVVDQSLLDDFNLHLAGQAPQDAKHISPGAEAALANPASGGSLSASNVVVDSQVKVVKRVEIELDSLSGVYQVQLTGRYFVGNETIDTAKLYFFLAKQRVGGDTDFVYRRQEQLVGSDNQPITVLGLYPQGTANPGAAPTPSTPGVGSLINPAADADANGFVLDPVVRLNFEHTVDDGYTGDLTVLCVQELDLGDITPKDLMHPLVTYPAAKLLPNSQTNFTTVSGLNVQDTLDDIDASLTQEIADRIAGDIASGTALLSTNNTWTGTQNWLQNFLGLGTNLLATTPNALQPRIAALLRTAVGEFTLLWESVASGNKALRMYGKADGTLLFTVNARFDGANWLKTINGQEAMKLELTNLGLGVYNQTAGTNSWADSAWTNTNLTIDGSTGIMSPQLMAAGTTFETSTTDSGAYTARIVMPTTTTADRTLMLEGNLAGEPEVRVYHKNGDGALEITFNAEFADTFLGTDDWEKDINGETAYKLMLGPTGLTVYEQAAGTNDWVDGAWTTTLLDLSAAGLTISNTLTAPRAALGASLIGSDANALLARVTTDVRDGAAGTRTLVWEGQAGSGAYSRIYVNANNGVGSGISTVEIVTNATWTLGAPNEWTQIEATAAALMLEVGPGGIIVRSKAAGAGTWVDGAWDSSSTLKDTTGDSSIAQTLSVGDGIIGNVADALLPRLLMDIHSVSDEYTLLLQAGTGSNPKTRVYVQNDGATQTVFWFTVNAEREATQWVKDDDGQTAFGFAIENDSTKSYFQESATDTWTSWTTTALNVTQFTSQLAILQAFRQISITASTASTDTRLIMGSEASSDTVATRHHIRIPNYNDRQYGWYLDAFGIDGHDGFSITEEFIGTSAPSGWVETGSPNWNYDGKSVVRIATTDVIGTSTIVEPAMDPVIRVRLQLANETSGNGRFGFATGSVGALTRHWYMQKSPGVDWRVYANTDTGGVRFLDTAVSTGDINNPTTRFFYIWMGLSFGGTTSAKIHWAFSSITATTTDFNSPMGAGGPNIDSGVYDISPWDGLSDKTSDMFFFVESNGNISLDIDQVQIRALAHDP